MTDGINLVMGDDGVFREAPEHYMTLAIDTEEEWNALQDAVNRGNRMRWISAEDKLPEDNDNLVLVIANGKYENITLTDAYCLANYYTDEGWVLEMYPEFEDVKITYWMPLPEPPKEKK